MSWRAEGVATGATAPGRGIVISSEEKVKPAAKRREGPLDLRDDLCAID
jgi:hypothetical protein